MASPPDIIDDPRSGRDGGDGVTPDIDLGRRAALRGGSAAALAIGTAFAASASAQSTRDNDYLNLLLNIAYVVGESLSWSLTGSGLNLAITLGTGTRGTVVNSRRYSLPSATNLELSWLLSAALRDQIARITFLRKTLGNAAVAEPAIDLKPTLDAQVFFEPVGTTRVGALIARTGYLLLVQQLALGGMVSLIGDGDLRKTVQRMTLSDAYRAGSMLTIAQYYATQRDFSSNNLITFSPFDMLKKTVPQSVSNGWVIDTGSGMQGSGEGWASITPIPGVSNVIFPSITPAQALSALYLSATPVNQGGYLPSGANGQVSAGGQL